MTKQGSLGIVVVVAAVGLTVACDLTLRAGKVGNKTNAPGPDGSCPTGLVVCGTGAFARCVDLQADHEHCGSCATVCLPGIACAAGACQQIACTGPVTVSTQIPAETTAPTDPPIDGAIFADVNGDGHPDLVTWQATDLESLAWGTFRVALGEAGGGFGAASTYQTASQVSYIFAADWNADGFDDLYVTDGEDSNCLVLWMGHADGSLSVAADIGDAGCLIPMVAADLNGDGNMDLVAYHPLGPSPPTVFLADAHGAFHVGTPLSNHEDLSRLVVRDWNGDGSPDLVAVQGNLSVYLNKGNGTFGDEIDCGVYASGQVVVADFNRDGHLDVATSPTDDDVGILLGMGGCQFQPMTNYRFSDYVLNVVYADVDGDGIGDLLARTVDGSNFLMRGAGDGTFQVSLLSSDASSHSTQCSLLVGDVTRDAKVDVVVTCYTATPQPPIQIQENTCP